MPQTVTDLIELGVGLACLAGAALARRRPGLRWFAALAAIAGVAAIGHALWSLAQS